MLDICWTHGSILFIILVHPSVLQGRMYRNLMKQEGRESMSQIIAGTMSTAVPWFLLVAGLIVTTLVDPYINRRNQKLFLIIGGLVLLLMLAEIADCITADYYVNDDIRKYAIALGYGIRPFLLVLSLQLFCSRVRWYHWTMAGVNAFINFTLRFPDGKEKA